MYTLNFNEIPFSPSIDKEMKKGIELNRLNAIRRGKTEEEAKVLFPDDTFDQIQECEEAINNALAIYFTNKYKKDNNSVLVPMVERKTASKLRMKIETSEDGIVELSDEQYRLLLEVLRSDLPPTDSYMYLLEYIEGLKDE